MDKRTVRPDLRFSTVVFLKVTGGMTPHLDYILKAKIASVITRIDR